MGAQAVRPKPITAIVCDSRYLEHQPAAGHPEQPSRLAAVYQMLDTLPNDHLYSRITPRKASREEVLMVHAPHYFDWVAATDGIEMTFLTPDTHASAASFQTALLAAGGVFDGIDRVMGKQNENAFALIRPPGHHAEKAKPVGYCIFNNIALGAAYARRVYALKRVLIVDWDVHHGNGTQHIFERDASVLFFSTHQYPYFPGTGSYTDTGIGPGEGTAVNVPLSGGFTDADMAAVYHQLLRPVAESFAPQLILVSAGFDTHKKDPLGAMRLTSAGFAALMRIVMDIAENVCDGRIVLALEGGYDPLSLAKSVQGVLHELSGTTRTDIGALVDQAKQKRVDRSIVRCRHVQQPYWKCLSFKRGPV